MPESLIRAFRSNVIHPWGRDPWSSRKIGKNMTEYDLALGGEARLDHGNVIATVLAGLVVALDL